MESGQEGAGLPVLRHRFARAGRTHRHRRRRSSSSTIWSRLARHSRFQRGWQAAKTSVKCQSCQAISVFDAARVGQRCDFCGSTALVPYEEIKEPFRPESLLPMKLSENQVRDSIRNGTAAAGSRPTNSSAPP
jgi:ribosomal protein S27E